jgi:hypothetical protein
LCRHSSAIHSGVNHHSVLTRARGRIKSAPAPHNPPAAGQKDVHRYPDTGREIATLADRQAVIVDTLCALDLVHGAEIDEDVVAVYCGYRETSMKADMTDTANTRQQMLIEAQIALYARQARWEPWKALAMILIAAAAIAAAGGIAGRMFPSQPQQIVVHFEQPLAVRVQP